MTRYLIPLLVPVFLLFMPDMQALGLEMPHTLIEQSGLPLLIPGQPIPVQALVSDPAGIFAVRCYFRYRQDADFVFIEMERKEDGLYQGVVPAPGEAVLEMEYLYLAVNERRQVVRTPVYTVNGSGKVPLPTPASSENERFTVQTDLAAPPAPGSLLFSGGQVKITSGAAAEQFGLVAGLYNSSFQAAGGDKAREGYFGGYELQPDGMLIPIKGIISSQEKVLPGAETGTTPLRAKDELPPAMTVGPDIAGDTWEGLCYYGWGEATGDWYVSYPTPVTATVLHEGNQVTITLSAECMIYWENMGQIFQGSMDSAGSMLLLDQRDPVQTWSSHWGPVTETEIKIGDYVTPFDPENNPYPDYYVIELKREYPPPPPPPPPPNYSFLPAVYKLLLPQAP